MKKKSILYPAHENGIYRYEYPLIGGIKQYIQIRGTDRSNPLLLFIHGGPGGALSGITHILHAGWEEHFTVVNWDQRNAGKTYIANKAHAKAIAETGTMEDFLRDMDDIIAYLHTVYDFDRLILMGFSWGSAIGAEYAKRHPEHLLCYIGVGQQVNYREGVLCTCRKMLGMVPEESRDAEKIQDMIDRFPEHPVWNRMQHMRHFMPLSLKLIIRHARKVPPHRILASPFMNLREKLTVMFPNYALHKQAFVTMLGYDFREDLHFDVPLLFVFGEEETVCAPALLETCFDGITAPDKQLVILPEASHSCYFDQPERFLETVSEFLQRC